MKIEVTFHVEPDDPAEYTGLTGKVLTIDNVDQLALNTVVDTTSDGNGGKLPMGSGNLRLDAHGDRALWSEADQ